MNRFFVFVITALLAVNALAQPKSPEEYIEIYNSGLQIQKEKAAETLAWAGLSSPQLFDLVEQEALKNYKSAKKNVPVNYVSWQVRALGFSGNEKYRGTIEQILKGTPSKKVKKYAKMALQDLDKYKEINKIILPGSWPGNAYPELNKRLANLLNSDNPEAKRIAAKRIHYTHNYELEMLEVLDAQIKENFKGQFDKLELDAMAWMCKALAGSRAVEFKPTIEEVALNAPDKKLRRYAKKYLNYFD